jgi:hypothetical protein
MLKGGDAIGMTHIANSSIIKEDLNVGR